MPVPAIKTAGGATPHTKHRSMVNSKRIEMKKNAQGAFVSRCVKYVQWDERPIKEWRGGLLARLMPC